MWYAAGGVFSECPVESVPPVNTIGSGDAFTAGLAAALDDGLPFAGAVTRGVYCGGLNAGLLKPGVIREPCLKSASSSV